MSVLCAASDNREITEEDGLRTVGFVIKKLAKMVEELPRGEPEDLEIQDEKALDLLPDRFGILFMSLSRIACLLKQSFGNSLSIFAIIYNLY